MRANRLAGHALPAEGRIFADGYHIWDGPAVCTCGEMSPSLPSDGARRKWHRDHKAAVRASRTPDPATEGETP